MAVPLTERHKPVEIGFVPVICRTLFEVHGSLDQFQLFLYGIFAAAIIFSSGDLAQKRRLIGSIFPENLTFDGENYRTGRINEVVNLIYLVNRELKSKKRGQNLYEKTLPRLVDTKKLFSNHLKEDIWVLLRFMDDLETNRIG